MPDTTQAGDPYRLETVTRACEVLKCFEVSEPLRLGEVAHRTGINKTIVFRILHTLVASGLLETCGERAYRSRIRIDGAGRFRMGYAAQAHNTPFSDTVTAAIRMAAAKANVDLAVLDNRYSPTTAVRNARRLAALRVDLALEFQTHDKVAAAIAGIFREAGIPLITIDVPHPGATFYGADNYRIGLLAGTVLGRWARLNCAGEPPQLLLLHVEAAGPVPRLRLSAAETGVRETLSHLAPNDVIHLEAQGDFQHAIQAVRRYLSHAPARKTLITGINDAVVLGALRAFEEAGRSPGCAGVSIGATEEARRELRRKGTRLIGAISLFPERYGEDLMALAMDILHRRHVPPAVCAHFDLITAQKVDQLYAAECYANPAGGLR